MLMKTCIFIETFNIPEGKKVLIQKHQSTVMSISCAVGVVNPLRWEQFAGAEKFWSLKQCGQEPNADGRINQLISIRGKQEEL